MMYKNLIRSVVGISCLSVIAIAVDAQAQQSLKKLSTKQIRQYDDIRNRPAVSGQHSIVGYGQTPLKTGRKTVVSNTLSADEQWALNEAIQDEYKARATYAKVIELFGEVRPFSNIIHSETRHIAALANLYNQYGLEVPEDTHYGNGPEFASLEDAATAAIQAEIDNAAIYDTIMEKVNNPDLIRVFTALQYASIERHLPAFERVLTRGNGQGRGMGYGRGRGGQGRGMGYGRGQGGQGRGMGYGRGQGGQGRGMGYGRGQGGQGRGMGYGRGQGGQGKGMGYGRGQGGQGRGMGYGQVQW